jgi:multidrug transporter EmrE-like cation transporter
MIWIAVTIALDALATTSSRLSHGFTRAGWAAATLLAYAGVFIAFSKAVQALPVGPAYALWSGLGTVLIVTIGALAFEDRISSTTIIGIALILAGVALLNSTGIRSS